MRIPVYGSELKLVIAKDQDAAAKALATGPRRRWLAFIKQGAVSAAIQDKGTVSVVFVYDARKSIDADLVFHEVDHAVDLILHYHGIPKTKGPDEAAAYLSGWVGNAVMLQLNRKRIKVKTRERV